MAATTSSSSSCAGAGAGAGAAFFHLRANEAKVRSSPGCGRIDGVAMWIINGVATAFFASLERCSCIRIATVDDHDGDDSNDLPLIFNDGNSAAAAAAARDSSSSRRRTTKGKKNGALIIY